MSISRHAMTGLRCALAAQLALYCASIQAVEIPDVLPISYDQPQIYGALVRSGDTPLMQYLTGRFSYFKAFLDTGASGIVLDPITLPVPWASTYRLMSTAAPGWYLAMSPSAARWITRYPSRWS